MVEKNEGEGADDVRMVLNLSKATFHIITMDNDVFMRVANTEIPKFLAQASQHVTISALQFTTKGSACHIIYGLSVFVWAQPSVKYLARRFRRREVDVLRGKERMTKVPCNPVGQRECKVVFVFLEHILRDEFSMTSN
jgi:nitrogen-specific signal transduction histidine kinase